MAQNSKIEWTHHTFNPWRGCTKVSAGCDNCYAEKMSGRNPNVLGVWGKYGTRVVASDAMWREPLKWNRAAEQAGERHRVFCASLADVFESGETIPTASLQAVGDARERLFELIEHTPHLDWLLLTKRPENVLRWLTPDCGSLPEERAYAGRIDLPPNVWIGTSVEDQKTADERIPHLLRISAKVRFLSIEPLLGPVDLTSLTDREIPPNLDDCLQGHNAINWVIVGGESGPNARPMHVDWVRSIRDQCVEAGVPVFVKQLGANVWDRNDAGFDGDYPHEWPMDTDTDDWHLDPARNYQGARCRVILGDRKGGNWSEWPEDLRIREFPEAK